MAISKLARRNIIDTLRVSNIQWKGPLNEIDFLSRIWDLNALPSKDYRFHNAEEDIYQHRINNLDWPDNWVYSDDRFGLIDGSDVDLLRFLCETIHPVLIRDSEEKEFLLKLFNDNLKNEGWEIIINSFIGDNPVYSAKRLDVHYDSTPRLIDTIKKQ